MFRTQRRLNYVDKACGRILTSEELKVVRRKAEKLLGMPSGKFKRYSKSQVYKAVEKRHTMRYDLLPQTFDNLRSSAIVHTNLCCPISQLLFWDPVVASDGITYEREYIERWIETEFNPVSPLTKKPLAKTVYPNLFARRAIAKFVQKYEIELPMLSDKSAVMLNAHTLD
jgi:hypothetical protein